MTSLNLSMPPLLEVKDDMNDDFNSLTPIENLDHTLSQYYSFPEFEKSTWAAESPLVQVFEEHNLPHLHSTEQTKENIKKRYDHPTPPAEPLACWTDFETDLTVDDTDQGNDVNKDQAESMILDSPLLTPLPSPRPAFRQLPPIPTESSHRDAITTQSTDEPEFNIIPFGLSREQRLLYRAHQTTAPPPRHSNQLLQHPVPFCSRFYSQHARGTPPRPRDSWYLDIADPPRAVPYRMRAIVRKMPITFWRVTDPETRKRSYRWDVCGKRSSKEIELANRSNAIESMQPNAKLRRAHLYQTTVSGRRGGCITTHELDGAIPIKSMARNFYKWGVLQEDKLQKYRERGRHLPRRRTTEKRFSLVMTRTLLPTYVSDRGKWFFCNIEGGMWLSTTKRDRLGSRKVAGQWAPAGISVFRGNVDPESRARAEDGKETELGLETETRIDDTPAPPIPILDSVSQEPPASDTPG
ncbi:hypothetical protein K440DRAFT_638971 [Wilcoxina mikolae CBS 423.85]|nr:hypothetical protein K440DRAFT_638971 [Wilcoxina mikolae CBS 423.85]